MQITTLVELGTAALERKRVVVPESENHKRPRTARYFTLLPEKLVLYFINLGMFVHETKKKL